VKMHTLLSKIEREFKPSKTFSFLLQAVVIFSSCIAIAQAQGGRNRPSARDTVRQIQRAELDRLLLLKPITAKKEADPTQAAMLKQLREDFKTMQNVNNKMMAEVWEREEVDYEHVSTMISQIKDRASRLKDNLLFPQSELETKAPILEASTAKEFRGVLMRLDQSIMDFVTNPLFQKANVMDLNLAAKAHHDLEVVISLSGMSKKIATKLSHDAKRIE
jgi:hypothetical protein